MNIENYKLIKVDKKEMNNVINFLNYCFNIKFQNVVGKLYKDEVDYSNNHYIIKKDNNIIAAICINESEWIIADNKIKVAGIGSVCVHPDYRNKGIMQYMLNESNNIIRNLKADISILSGRYDRYNHFGYETTTQCIDYEIPFDKKYINTNYKFILIDSLTNGQIDYLAKLNKNKNQYIKRLDNVFIESCKQWEHTAYGIFKNNNLIGYIVNKENVIKEIKLKNDEEMLNILYNFIDNLNAEKINVLIPSIEYMQKDILKNFEHKLIDKKSQLCQIINYEKVIKILLMYKNKHEKLKKGTLTIKIKNYGGIKINVDDDIVISKYNSNNYDLTLSNMDALKLFLNDNEKLNLESDIRNICDSWFPLDIYLYVADLI